MSPEPLEILAGDPDCILDELLQQGPGGEVGPGLGLVHWSNSNQPPMQPASDAIHGVHVTGTIDTGPGGV